MDLTPEEFAEKIKNDDAFLKAVYEQALADIEARNDEDYEINPPQWAKFIEVFSYFQKITSEPDAGSLDECVLQPKRVCGYLKGTLTFIPIEKINKEEVIKILQMVDTIDLLPTLEGKIEFSVVVEDVFKKKNT